MFSDNGTSKSELTREFVLFAVSTGVFQASRFGTAVVAARWTGPEEFGVWNALQLIILYGVVSMLGVPSGMSRQVPFLLGKGDAPGAARVEDLSFWLTLIGATCLGLVVGVAGVLGLGGAAYRQSLFAVALLFPMWHLYQYFQLRLKSRVRFTLVSVQQLIFAILLPAVTLPLVSLWRVPGYIIGQCAVALLLVLFIWKAGRMRIHLLHGWAGLGEITRIGFPIMLAGLVYGLLISVDRIMVLNFLGTEALGRYTLPILCVTALNLLPAVVSQQMYPRMAFKYGQTHDVQSLVPMAIRQSLAAGIVVLPVVLVIYLALPYLTTHFLTEYRDGVAPARLLLVGLGLIALSGGAGNLLNTVGKQVYYMAALATGVVVNIVAIGTLLALGKGIMGVAAGAVISYAIFVIVVNLVALNVVHKSR